MLTGNENFVKAQLVVQYVVLANSSTVDAEAVQKGLAWTWKYCKRYIISPPFQHFYPALTYYRMVCSEVY